MKKGGKRSSLDEEGRLYKEGKGKYSNLRESDFCGPAGNAPMGTFPVDTEKRCSAALSYARNAPNPDGIVECAMKKAKENGWKCGKNSKKVKKMKKNKKGGWIGATIGTTAGLAVGYGVGIGLPGKIKEKFSSNSASSSDVKETGNDGFNKVDAPEKKEDTPIENVGIVPTGGAKCQDDEHHHPGHHKSKKNGCMKNSDMGGSKKKSKGKKSKGKGKKSAYSQFLSKELKRVGDAHPDWPQPKVFKEAVSNWSNSK